MRLLSLCLPIFTYSSLRGIDESPTSTIDSQVIAQAVVEEPISEILNAKDSESEKLSGRIFSFKTDDDESIVFRSWEPKNGDPKAVVYIVHGMAEHSGRYSAFAQQLVEVLDVKVIAPDQRGHGLTSTRVGTAENELGKFRSGESSAKSNAISIMGNDISALILDTHKGLPVIVFGHSMGSVVARTALQQADPKIGQFVKGLVLSGVPRAPHWLEMYPLSMVASLVKTIGLGHEFAQRTVTHYKLDEPIRKKTNMQDLPVNCFVSSDLEECEIFNKDPYTNHLVDLEILFSFATTLAELEKATYFGPNSIDALFITGREDPVAAFGATARDDADRMIKAGHQVTEIFLSRSRHEFLHEQPPTRKEGTAQVIAWIRTKLDL